MPDFEAMYFTMFNQVTDTIRQMEQQIRTLKQLQLQMEQQYIEQKNQHISYTICKDFPARRNDHFLQHAGNGVAPLFVNY